MAVLPLTTSKGHVIYVEADDTESMPTFAQSRSDLPPGAEPVTAAHDVLASMRSLQTGLKDLIADVHHALSDSKPDSIKVEISVGFKGKTSPIPVLVSGEASAALKLTLGWEKSPAKDDAS